MCRSPTCARKPIGTGPFKFVEFKMNESIKLAKNTDYWKPGRPYLDGIEYTIIADRSTRMLAFVSRQVRHDLPDRRHGAAAEEHPQRRAEGAMHHARDRRQHQPDRQPRDAAVRRSRRSAARWRSTLDRKAFIDILSEGEGKIGGAMLPPPDGVWGMPPEMLKTIIGYGDVAKAARRRAS